MDDSMCSIKCVFKAPARCNGSKIPFTLLKVVDFAKTISLKVLIGLKPIIEGNYLICGKQG